MIQVSVYTWRLETPQGKMIAENISLNDRRKAEKWAKNYASSFRNWVVVMKPLPIGDGQ